MLPRFYNASGQHRRTRPERDAWQWDHSNARDHSLKRGGRSDSARLGVARSMQNGLRLVGFWERALHQDVLRSYPQCPRGSDLVVMVHIAGETVHTVDGGIARSYVRGRASDKTNAMRIALSAPSLQTLRFVFVVHLIRPNERLSGRNPSHETQNRYRLSHSCRNASIGSSWAARRAGKKPKITPIAAEKRNASTLICGLKR